MRIAIVGTQNSGKSLLIKNFLDKWPMYKKASPTYRDLVKKDVPLNQLATKDSQELIRNALVEQAVQNKDEKYCIHDRCTLDNLIYSLWLADKGKIDDDQFITSSFHMTRETMKYYDAIFLLSLDPANPIPLEERDGRDIDENYRAEINDLFLAAHDSYMNRDGLMFPVEDCPGFIIIKGDELKGEKIADISQYINDDGDLPEDSTLIEDFEQEYRNLLKDVQKKKASKQ